MSDDPSGYYAALDVHSRAELSAIAAAFRRKARVLHPDVPGTGDAEAFMRVKAAYDVVGDAQRRAAYDRAARTAVTATPAARHLAEPVLRWPRVSDLPPAVWAAFGCVVLVSAAMTLVHLSRSPPTSTGPTIRAVAPPGSSAGALPKPASLPSSGPSSHYVMPGPDAVLWRHDAARNAFVPAGHVAAFSPVQALRLVPQHGLIEIRLADGGSGFIDAARLATGSRDDARRAYCAYEAGPAPRNGEILGRSAFGPASLVLSNRGAQSAVVKLRDSSGRAIAAVFVEPGHSAVLHALPNVSYRPEFAIGELWSRACNDFAAGMRAQRFPFYGSPAGLSPLVIPPDPSATPAPVDISDAAFDSE